MHYDAAVAAFESGRLLFVLPHLIGGGALLFAAVAGKCWLRGLSGTVGVLIQGAVGALFFGLAAFSIAHDTVETFRCRQAAVSGAIEKVKGKLVVTERFVKPGTGYIRFSVGERPFRTATLGLNCDCGFIRPLGRTTRLIDDQHVEVEVFQGTVVRLVSTGPA